MASKKIGPSTTHAALLKVLASIKPEPTDLNPGKGRIYILTPRQEDALTEAEARIQDRIDEGADECS